MTTINLLEGYLKELLGADVKVRSYKDTETIIHVNYAIEDQKHNRQMFIPLIDLIAFVYHNQNKK